MTNSNSKDPAARWVWVGVILFLAIFWGGMCFGPPGARHVSMSIIGFLADVLNV